MNTALPLSLAVALTANSGDTIVQVPSTSGYPSAPFTIGLERGTIREEVCLCTGLTSTSFTVTRGYDGSVPQVHLVNTPVEHVSAAIDYREANLHINDDTRDDHGQYQLRSTLTNKGGIYTFNGTSVVQLNPGADSTYLTADSSQATGWNFTNPFLPGMIIEFGGSAAPTGFLLCDGSLYDRVTFVNLFSIIGTQYMTSADITTYAPGSAGGGTNGKFRVPDHRGRVGMGSGQGLGLSNRTLGQGNSSVLGAETHTIAVGEIPLHSHQGSTLVVSNTGAHDHGPGGATNWQDSGGGYQLLTPIRTGGQNEAIVLAPGHNTGISLAGDWGTQVTWTYLTTDGAHAHTISGNTGTGNSLASTSTPILQPAVVVNFIIRF